MKNWTYNMNDESKIESKNALILSHIHTVFLFLILYYDSMLLGVQGFRISLTNIVCVFQVHNCHASVKVWVQSRVWRIASTWVWRKNSSSSWWTTWWREASTLSPPNFMMDSSTSPMEYYEHCNMCIYPVYMYKFTMVFSNVMTLAFFAMNKNSQNV